MASLNSEQQTQFKRLMEHFATRNPDPRITRRVTDSDHDYYRRLFTFFVAHRLTYLHDDELFDRLKIVDRHESGVPEESLDAYLVIDQDDEIRLHLFQFKYTEKFDKSISPKELRSFVRRMNDEFQHGDINEPSVIAAFNLVKSDLAEALRTNPRRPLRIRCHYVVNGHGIDHDADRNKVNELRESYLHDQNKYGFQFEAYGGLDIFNLVVHGRIPIHDELLEFEAPHKQGDVLHVTHGKNREGLPEEVLVGFMNVNQLIRLVTRYSANELFERNVRLYLGGKNRVNREIIETVTSSKNTWFGYMNNGVSITADKVVLPGVRKDGKLPVVLTNMQIINGCQTVNSLRDAKYGEATRDRFNANSTVLVRIYGIDPKNEDFMESMILATNRQSAIRAEDLVSNDKTLELTQKLLHDYGVGFERKEGERFSKNGYLTAMAKEDVASAWYAVFTDDAPKLWGVLGRAKLFLNESAFRLVFPENLDELPESAQNERALRYLLAHLVLFDCRVRLMKQSDADLRRARYYVARLVSRAARQEVNDQLATLSQKPRHKDVGTKVQYLVEKLVEELFENSCRTFKRVLEKFCGSNSLGVDAALKSEQFANLVFKTKSKPKKP